MAAPDRTPKLAALLEMQRRSPCATRVECVILKTANGWQPSPVGSLQNVSRSWEGLANETNPEAARGPRVRVPGRFTRGDHPPGSEPWQPSPPTPAVRRGQPPQRG